jgi:hypothetical protein
VEPSAGSAAERAPGVPSPPGVRGSGGAGACPLEWTVNPWRERPLAALAAALVALGLWLLVLRLLPGERAAATVLGLLLLASLAPGMAPTRCRVDAEGAARQVLFTWERRRWTDVRRARLAARGLFVSPLARPGRLDRFRGLFLPLPAHPEGGADLGAALRRELDRHGL